MAQLKLTPLSWPMQWIYFRLLKLQHSALTKPIASQYGVRSCFNRVYHFTYMNSFALRKQPPLMLITQRKTQHYPCSAILYFRVTIATF